MISFYTDTLEPRRYDVCLIMCCKVRHLGKLQSDIGIPNKERKVILDVVESRKLCSAKSSLNKLEMVWVNPV
jgi:hypothetical protein